MWSLIEGGMFYTVQVFTTSSGTLRRPMHSRAPFACKPGINHHGMLKPWTQKLKTKQSHLHLLQLLHSAKITTLDNCLDSPLPPECLSQKLFYLLLPQEKNLIQDYITVVAASSTEIQIAKGNKTFFLLWTPSSVSWGWKVTTSR